MKGKVTNVKTIKGQVVTTIKSPIELKMEAMALEGEDVFIKNHDVSIGQVVTYAHHHVAKVDNPEPTPAQSAEAEPEAVESISEPEKRIVGEYEDCSPPDFEGPCFTRVKKRLKIGDVCKNDCCTSSKIERDK